MSSELKPILSSLLIPLLFIVVCSAVKLVEVTAGMDLHVLGIYPLHWKGLIGIITGPLIHKDWAHLYSNAFPILILGGCIYFFYSELATRVILMIYLLTGLWVWFGGRDAYHIGASGLAYGFSAFLFLSGILRRDMRLMAISLLVIFLYGGMVWGLFPELFPEKNISWEAHLYGIISGIVAAVFFRRSGPQRKKYSWELEEEEEMPDWYPEDKDPRQEENQDSKTPEVPPPPKEDGPLKINYIYKKDREE